MDPFRTARLLAERPRLGDFAELCRLRQDPEVAATLGSPLPDERTRQTSRPAWSL